MFKAISTTILFYLLFRVICQQSYAQVKIDKSYYRSPLDIGLYLSGNFGEMRTNHFHTGLDIKTAGVEGQNVRACADGYVARIKNSPWGYGNVLYVNHPNGQTTVYAHLNRFNSEIDSFYRSVQFRKQQYAIDVYPGPSMLPVKKGDLIAYSGNSGSSGGPHLHFEIRNTENDRPINPMLFGFDIKDNIPPRIQGIRIYQFPNDSLPGICNRTHLVSGGANGYALRNGSQLELNGYGMYGLAVHTTDMLNGSGNICGVHNIQLYLDGKLIYEHQMDSLDFYTNRYMNAHTDYAYFKETKKSFHKSFIEPNNKLDLYKTAKNRGLFSINDTKEHQVEYIITDVSGNVSKLNFTLKNNKTSSLETSFKQEKAEILCCDNSSFVRDDFACYFVPGIVYNNLPVDYKKSEQKAGRYSATHSINNTDIPVQQKYLIKIKAEIPSNKQDKAIIVEEYQGRLYPAGGSTYDNGWVSARVRSFGTFYVMIDDTAPEIAFSNIRDGQQFNGKYIYINAGDNLSGMADYNAFINGNWAPTEYDSKKRRYIIHLSDLSIPEGENTLKFEAKDERGNMSSQSIKFHR